MIESDIMVKLTKIDASVEKCEKKSAVYGVYDFFLIPVFWIESIIKMCKIFLIRYSAWYRSMPNTRVILKKNLFLNIRYIYSHPCMHRVLEKMEKTKKDENCDNTDCDNATVRGWVDDDMHTHAHLTSEYAQNIMP